MRAPTGRARVTVRRLRPLARDEPEAAARIAYPARHAERHRRGRSRSGTGWTSRRRTITCDPDPDAHRRRTPACRSRRDATTSFLQRLWPSATARARSSSTTTASSQLLLRLEPQHCWRRRRSGGSSTAAACSKLIEFTLLETSPRAARQRGRPRARSTQVTRRGQDRAGRRRHRTAHGATRPPAAPTQPAPPTPGPRHSRPTRPARERRRRRRPDPRARAAQARAGPWGTIALRAQGRRWTIVGLGPSGPKATGTCRRRSHIWREHAQRSTT